MARAKQNNPSPRPRGYSKDLGGTTCKMEWAMGLEQEGEEEMIGPQR